MKGDIIINFKYSGFNFPKFIKANNTGVFIVEFVCLLNNVYFT